MRSLNISEFAIVGLSVGGMWGTYLTLRHPEAVKALVLMDTFVGSEPPIMQQKYFALLDILEKEKSFTPPLLEKIVPLFFSPHTMTNKKHLVENFRENLLSIKSENIPGIVALGRAIFSRQCLLNELSQIAQPTLVLVGKDDLGLVK